MTSSDTETLLSPPATRRLRYPAIVELIILGLVALVLMIGLLMIGGLVSERAQRAESVRREIASSWAQSQTVSGPLLVIPYRVHYLDKEGKAQVTIDRARFLPQKLAISGRLHPERRHRGIYETVLYRADLRMDGSFERPDFSIWNVAAEDVLWNDATVILGITDLRGIRGNPVMTFNGRPLKFAGGSGDSRLLSTGLTAPAQINAREAAIAFSLALNLNGSEQVSFLPLGGETEVRLESSWPDPSFSGAFLPETRTVTEKGFAARWTISSLARSYPQQWREASSEAVASAVMPSAFGVGLFSPVGHYQKTERAVKYGALFIILTFLTFFLYELLSPVTLHPVQYFLVGGAICVFYLLLLSFSEHASFALAYAIASFATIVLIALYGAALLRNFWRVLGLAGVLSALYGYLYVLLQLEDWALLMGSIGLFLILALVMYTTRRVDWGSAHLGAPRTSEA